MKRSLVIIVAMLMVTLIGGNAFAAKASSGGAKTEVDGMLSIATDPASGLGTTIGLGAGVGFDLTDQLKPGSGKLFGRVDINYFSWDETIWWGDWTYTRVPIFVGGRYYIPSSGSNVNVFVEAGLEFSFDKMEAPVPWYFGARHSESDLNIGITPGAGIEVPISNDGLFIGGDARWHMITDDYFTLSLVLGKKF